MIGSDAKGHLPCIAGVIPYNAKAITNLIVCEIGRDAPKTTGLEIVLPTLSIAGVVARYALSITVIKVVVVIALQANIAAFHRLSWRAGAVAELLVLVGLTVIGAVFGLAQHVVTVTFAYKITKTGTMWCAPRAMTGIKNEVVILTGRFFWPISWFPNFSPNFGGFLNH